MPLFVIWVLPRIVEKLPSFIRSTPLRGGVLKRQEIPPSRIIYTQGKLKKIFTENKLVVKFYMQIDGRYIALDMVPYKGYQC